MNDAVRAYVECVRKQFEELEKKRPPKEYIQCSCCRDLVWKMTTVITQSSRYHADYWCPICWKTQRGFREISE